VCEQVSPAIQHSKNNAYYIPQKVFKMFFGVDYLSASSVEKKGSQDSGSNIQPVGIQAGLASPDGLLVWNAEGMPRR
jgi:hypothetical protein